MHQLSLDRVLAPAAELAHRGHGIGVGEVVLLPPRGLQLDLQPDAVGVIEIEGLAVLALDDQAHLNITVAANPASIPPHYAGAALKWIENRFSLVSV